MIRSTVAGNIELEELNGKPATFCLPVLRLMVMLIVAAIDYRLWASVSRTNVCRHDFSTWYSIYCGFRIFGSARWFENRLFNIQPSEFAKIVIILVLFDFFYKRTRRKL